MFLVLVHAPRNGLLNEKKYTLAIKRRSKSKETLCRLRCNQENMWPYSDENYLKSTFSWCHTAWLFVKGPRQTAYSPGQCERGPCSHWNNKITLASFFAGTRPITSYSLATIK